MEPKKVVFAIVDISGYTQFIKSHKTSQIHAEEIIFNLLEAVIDQAEYPLIPKRSLGKYRSHVGVLTPPCAMRSEAPPGAEAFAPFDRLSERTPNKLEGDALFLYAELIAGKEIAVARDVARQVQAFFDAFHTRKDQLVQERTECSCHACRRVSDLRLKAFLHHGLAFFAKFVNLKNWLGKM